MFGGNQEERYADLREGRSIIKSRLAEVVAGKERYGELSREDLLTGDMDRFDDAQEIDTA